jgi:hypothetical protein
MQKISTYLYPNRIQLLADLAGFNVEYTNVYQRTVKIYNGIDNTLEFDVKNADQKRIDLSTVTNLQLNVMDAAGIELPSSPYTITPLNQTTSKGLATVTIPQEDLVDLQDQYFTYSVTCVKDGVDTILYADSRFGAIGTIELVGNAMPVFRDPKIVKDFTAEIDLHGNPIWHSSSIPAKFYEAVKTTTLTFDIHVIGFVGSIWIDATENDTINPEAYRKAGRPFGTWIWSGSPYTGSIPFATSVPVDDYAYFRVSYQTPTMNGTGALFNVTASNGTYTVTVNKGGTGYSVGAIMKVPGSLLGGVDGTNDLFVTVTGLEGGTSSYTVSSITSVTNTGTSIGSGTYTVSGINYSGIVDSITVS